jgi:hypothetical protein
MGSRICCCGVRGGLRQIWVISRIVRPFLASVLLNFHSRVVFRRKPFTSVGWTKRDRLRHHRCRTLIYGGFDFTRGEDTSWCYLRRRCLHGFRRRCSGCGNRGRREIISIRLGERSEKRLNKTENDALTSTKAALDRESCIIFRQVSLLLSNVAAFPSMNNDDFARVNATFIRRVSDFQ